MVITVRLTILLRTLISGGKMVSGGKAAGKSERLAVLSNAEQEALYGLPDFDDAQQLEFLVRHCCKVSDEAAFCLIQRPYISKTLLTRRISPRGSP